MRRSFISETVAKAIIFLIFTVTLLSLILFWYSAYSYTKMKPLLEEVQQLPNQLQLLGEVETLEDELQKARATAETAEKKSKEALEETQRLTSTQVQIADSLSLNYVGEYKATSYCCEEYPHICGGNGRTASGTVPTPGLTVAADWSILPSGTWIYIEGVGIRRVEDTGSAIKGKRIDVAIDTHANALRWNGQGMHHIWVLNWG